LAVVSARGNFFKYYLHHDIEVGLAAGMEIVRNIYRALVKKKASGKKTIL
jgi:hypothetical protein